MKVCKNCNTEYKETIFIRNENVCPYCYVKVNIIQSHIDLMDMVLSNNIIKQVIEGLDNKPLKLRTFIIIFSILSTITIILTFLRNIL